MFQKARRRPFEMRGLGDFEMQSSRVLLVSLGLSVSLAPLSVFRCLSSRTDATIE